MHHFLSLHALLSIRGRSRKTQTRNASPNANRNPQWWWDSGQLQIQIKPKSQSERVRRDIKEFKSTHNLNSNLYKFELQDSRNLNFRILAGWLDSHYHWGFRFACRRAFRISSCCGQAVYYKINVILYCTTLWSLYIIPHYYAHHSLLFHTSTDHSLFIHSLLYTYHSLVFYIIHRTLSVTLSFTLYYTQITLDLYNIYHVRNTLYYFLSYTEHFLLHFITPYYTQITLYLYNIYHTLYTLYYHLLYTEHSLFFSSIHGTLSLIFYYTRF